LATHDLLAYRTSALATFRELDAILTELHDCPFDLDSAIFDRASHTWRGTFLHPLWDSPAAQHHGIPLIASVSRLPVAKAVLSVQYVVDSKVVDNQGIGMYTFNRVEEFDDGLRLSCCEAMSVYLYLNGPVRAAYVERLDPALRAVYRQYCFLQAGPRIESVIEGPGAD
jgi:hypothetical protein